VKWHILTSYNLDIRECNMLSSETDTGYLKLHFISGSFDPILTGILHTDPSFYLHLECAVISTNRACAIMGLILINLKLQTFTKLTFKRSIR
jgi:hypothetical protein